MPEVWVGRIRREHHESEERILREPPFGPKKLRKTKLNDEVAAQICNYVYMGAPYDIAAEASGIPGGTEQDWRRRGMAYIAEIESGDAPEFPAHKIYAQYAQAVITARAKWQMRVLKRSFQDSFRSTWIRDLALLERRDPNNWRLRDEDILDEQDVFEADESFL